MGPAIGPQIVVVIAIPNASLPRAVPIADDAILGHSGLSTTADVYGAWTRDMAGRVASRMDEVLRKRTGG